MKMQHLTKYMLVLGGLLFLASCGKDFLELKPRGTTLETNFYQTQAEIFQGLVAAYDVMGWEGTDGWTMQLGLLNAASDDTFAGTPRKIKINGLGAYIELPKAANGAEVTTPQTSVTYDVLKWETRSGKDVIELQVNFGGGIWKFIISSK